MTDTKNLQKWSQVLMIASYLCLVCAPLSILAALLAGETAQLFAGLNSAQKSILSLIWALKPLILMGAFWQMIRLFGHFKAGDVLTQIAANCIKRIGQFLLASALVSFAVVPVQTLVLSMNNAPGARSISLSVSSDMILFGMAGGLIIVIGWAMREAAQVAQENRAFI